MPCAAHSAAITRVRFTSAALPEVSAAARRAGHERDFSGEVEHIEH
jgi:hypothetical protein